MLASNILKDDLPISAVVPKQASQETQYLDLISKILSTGSPRTDRTGTGTISIFAPTPLRFSLANNSFPLLTTKRVPARIIFEELIWFIRGKTDADLLKAKNVNIWSGNASREFLDSRGLTSNRAGDLGPVYGFQWRHFGASYRGIEGENDVSYEGQGTDQIREVIRQIRDDPTTRRIIISAWNPAALPEMALPPCHLLAQFYVEVKEGKQPVLSCQMYQRSADVGLGVPFNIASYALLTIMIAKVTGCVPGEFIHVMGDAHVYSDHVDALGEQVKRECRGFPTVEFVDGGKTWEEQRETGVDEMVKELEGMEWSDFKVEGYAPAGKLAMKMAV